ncbi:hypothetical protein [Sandarakinorhabdus sp. AAP62]|uniref:hypothetical protein n=1 Tax=Sandarakinorhabdus sp. AAP62 TaxID=1248916 RepID=UPI0012671D57|nr:hypothetical protein [Sandarakinorhabdus sp. AAP62]
MFEDRDTNVGGVVWVQRAFLVMAALWLVVQGHLGSFLGAWDESHLAGNICWLLIFYCLARTLLDWGLTSLRLHRISTDALFLAAVILGLEVAWQAIAGPTGMATTAGFAIFVMQPVLVVMGMASLHRQAFTTP